MSLPPLSPLQRAQALRAAGQARGERAALKEGLRSGELRLEEVFTTVRNQKSVARALVVEVLEALPGIGPVRAATIMASCGVAPGRRLRGLGARQRAALLAALPRA